jgi:hypothetical protein
MSGPLSHWLALSPATLLIVAFVGAYSCAPDQPVEVKHATQATEQNAAQARSPSPPPEQPRVPAELATSPSIPASSDETAAQIAWADGFRGELIGGLDGALYVPYGSATIERVQTSLKERGLYAGPVNGILNIQTMKAIYEFQEANPNLQVCGVPTPRTRKMLTQGSHTDLRS